MADRILIIDDDFPSGQTLMWAMEASGYKVCLALSAESALYELDTYHPDVVLCDINMPGIKGYEVCQKMRADERFKDTLFIAQTGYGSAESKQLSADAGFHYHFVKPVDLETLGEVIKTERDKIKLSAA